MVGLKKLKVLHLPSQRPDSTGSGIYVQAMMREASACGYDNYLVAGIQSDGGDVTDFIAQNNAMFVTFHNADVSYQIPGMSDVMPYESTRYCDISEEDLCEKGLAKIMRHSHILVLPSFYEGLPLVILEALASSCRIVATELPGTMELLGDYDTDFITLVRTPRLRFSDQPYREDEQLFEKKTGKSHSTADECCFQRWAI